LVRSGIFFFRSYKYHTTTDICKLDMCNNDIISLRCVVEEFQELRREGEFSLLHKFFSLSQVTAPVAFPHCIKVYHLSRRRLHDFLQWGAASKFTYKLTFKLFRTIFINLKECLQFLLLVFGIFPSYLNFDFFF
jgi:hypothetical protein